MGRGVTVKKRLTYDDLGYDQDKDAVRAHRDCMRWRFFKEEMDVSDKLRMLAAGTANYDKIIDRHRKVLERSAVIERRIVRRSKK
jgi:hypothetical protein